MLRGTRRRRGASEDDSWGRKQGCFPWASGTQSAPFLPTSVTQVAIFINEVAPPGKSVPSGSAAKNLPNNERHAGDAGSISGSEVGNGNPLQKIAWEIPWVKEPGGLQSMGLQRVGHD